MASIAALFQSFPAFFSEIFVFVTMVSYLPVYFSARINFKIGFMVYFITAFLVMLVSPHEAMMFLFTNGAIGLGLGVCNYFTERKFLIVTISSIILTCALSSLNFVIGIPIFGTDLPGSSLNKFFIIFGFAIFYSIISLLVANAIYRKLIKDKRIS